eukprot:TRINITY_DN61722_c0_g1_i1.p1 TRINITY_DN61722_c0_g1~~TRINITY_DN61722_c0_g1_i1.p1  ORF type:complete len:579 (-),score=103.64 TRINITY_DN61722_c0_g1_i1:218-1954(-)
MHFVGHSQHAEDIFASKAHFSYFPPSLGLQEKASKAHGGTSGGEGSTNGHVLPLTSAEETVCPKQDRYAQQHVDAGVRARRGASHMSKPTCSLAVDAGAAAVQDWQKSASPRCCLTIISPGSTDVSSLRHDDPSSGSTEAPSSRHDGPSTGSSDVRSTCFAEPTTSPQDISNSLPSHHSSSFRSLEEKVGSTKGSPVNHATNLEQVASSPRPELPEAIPPPKRDQVQMVDGSTVTAVQLFRQELASLEKRLNTRIAQSREDFAAELYRTKDLQEAKIDQLDQVIETSSSWQHSFGHELAGLGATVEKLAHDVRSVMAHVSGHRDALDQTELDLRRLCVEHESKVNAAAAYGRAAVASCEESLQALSLRLSRAEEELRKAGPSANLASDVLEASPHAQRSSTLHFTSSGPCSPNSPGSVGDMGLMESMQETLDNVLQGLDGLSMEAHGEGGWHSVLGDHEARLTSLATKVSSLGNRCDVLDGRLPHDFDEKFGVVVRLSQETAARQAKDGDSVEAVMRHVEVIDQAVENLVERLLRASSRGPEPKKERDRGGHRRERDRDDQRRENTPRSRRDGISGRH